MKLARCVSAGCSGVGVGHGFFPCVVAALEAVVRAPWHAGHSIGGLHLLQVAARRLASSSPQVGAVLQQQQQRQSLGVSGVEVTRSSSWCCSSETLVMHHLRAVGSTGCSCCGWLQAACW
jgi:hypothetical protein